VRRRTPTALNGNVTVRPTAELLRCHFMPIRSSFKLSMGCLASRWNAFHHLGTTLNVGSSFLTNPYFCWEQRAFLYINAPFRPIGTLAYLILNPVYRVLGLLVVPLTMVINLIDLLWLPFLIIIFELSKVSRRLPTIRPISFALALPFLVLGHFVVSIRPVPSSKDAECKMKDWKLIELFPYCHLAEYDHE